MIYYHPNTTLLEHLEPLIKLINPDGMAVESFRDLFKITENKCTFNVTSNQFKRIKYFLMTQALQQPELWANPLYDALCMDDWITDEVEEADPTQYYSEVAEFYTTLTTKDTSHTTVMAPDAMKLVGAGIKNSVIAEMHGTRAPLELLKTSMDDLIREDAALLVEGLSLEEIEEINHCNIIHACSLLLYMLIPVEKSMQRELIAIEKRQLVASLINAGIKIIPGDNKYSVNLPANEQRLRVFNYSAIKNALAADHTGPIVFWVGKAHAVKTEGCPGIASITGAKLIDLTDDISLISTTPKNQTRDPQAQTAEEEKAEEINFLFKFYLDHLNACKAILAGLALAAVIIIAVATWGVATSIAATIGSTLGFTGASATYVGTATMTTTANLLAGGCVFFASKPASIENDNPATVNQYAFSPRSI